jgi:AraC-like DNA-binding protein
MVDRILMIDCKLLPSESLAFNDGIPTMAVLSGNAATVEFNDGEKKIRAGAAWFSCRPLANIRILQHGEEGELFLIRFNPITIRYLQCLHACPIEDSPILPLSVLVGERGLHLPEAVCKARSTAEKLLLLENGIREWMPAPGKLLTNGLLDEALRAIRSAGGHIAIDKLAASLRVNYKWLERNFRRHIGISPKSYAGLQRFLFAYCDLLHTDGRDLMRTAIQSGYYDQNHFTREFRKFTGQPPLRYLETQRRQGRAATADMTG